MIIRKLGQVLLGIVMILGTLAEVAGTELRPEGENPAARQIQKTAREIWAGESGGFKIRWAARDIQIHPAKSPNRVIFSARSLANQEFARFQASEKKHGLGKRFCEVVCSYKILAVAGSLLSFWEEKGVNCEKTAHPSDTSRFTTIDLKKPGSVSQKRVKLTDYFPESAIYQALMAEPRVRQALARREPPLPRSPRNLAELYAAFKDVDLNTGEVNYGWPEDFLTRFAFHHLQGDQVAVHLALPALGRPDAGHNLELVLLLPVPASLKNSLALAAAGKEGFLLQDQERLSGGQYITMRFTKGKKPPDW